MGKKWPSWKFIYVFLTLPVAFVASIFKFYLIGPESRKLKNDIRRNTEAFLVRRLGQIPRKEISFISNYTIFGMLKNFKKNYPDLTSRLPGFGEQYDTLSTWVIKAPNRTASDPVIVYLHGGGYCYQGMPPQLKSVLSVYELLEPEKKKNLSILFLDYRLATQGHPFPAPVEDLHETYKNLTVKDKNTNTIFWGDSAGANLALVYLQHLKKVVQKREITNPVWPKNLVLVSPWLRVLPPKDAWAKGHSWYESDKEDFIKYARFSDPDFLDMVFSPVRDSLDDVTVSPLSTPFSRSDWDDIPTMAEDILVITGDTEGFRDDTLEFSEKLYGCPFLEKNRDLYNDKNSDGKFNESIHKFVYKTKNGKVGYKLLIDPWGNHGSTIAFETEALDKILKGERNLDSAKFFGTTRLTEYLNESL